MKNVGVSSINFTISNKKKTLTCEYSIIEHDKNYEEATSYKQNNNLEFINAICVSSARTGKITEWEWVNRASNGGDFLYDEFVPSAETLKNFPWLKGYKMTIFND